LREFLQQPGLNRSGRHFPGAKIRVHLRYLILQALPLHSRAHLAVCQRVAENTDEPITGRRFVGMVLDEPI
jgi:hypothetical protein